MLYHWAIPPSDNGNVYLPKFFTIPLRQAAILTQESHQSCSTVHVPLYTITILLFQKGPSFLGSNLEGPWSLYLKMKPRFQQQLFSCNHFQITCNVGQSWPSLPAHLQIPCLYKALEFLNRYFSLQSHVSFPPLLTSPPCLSFSNPLPSTLMSIFRTFCVFGFLSHCPVIVFCVIPQSVPGAWLMLGQCGVEGRRTWY